MLKHTLPHTKHFTNPMLINSQRFKEGSQADEDSKVMTLSEKRPGLVVGADIYEVVRGEASAQRSQLKLGITPVL